LTGKAFTRGSMIYFLSLVIHFVRLLEPKTGFIFVFLPNSNTALVGHHEDGPPLRVKYDLFMQSE